MEESRSSFGGDSDAAIASRLSSGQFEHVLLALLGVEPPDSVLPPPPTKRSRSAAGSNAYASAGKHVYIVKVHDGRDAIVSYRPQAVGVREIRELALRVKRYPREGRGMVVTSRSFSREAKAEARDANIVLVDRDRLVEWIARARTFEERAIVSMAHRIADLQTAPFGTLDFAPHERSPEPRIIVPQLALPSNYETAVADVNYEPFKMLRRVMDDPRAMRNFTPRQFEEFTAELIDRLGFENVLLTPAVGDGGRDVIASKRVHGIPITFFFECKQYSEGNLVQLNTLRALLGVVAHSAQQANIGVLVTTSRFTRGCKQLIASECRLDGKDYDGIIGWVNEYRQRFGVNAG